MKKIFFWLFAFFISCVFFESQVHAGDYQLIRSSETDSLVKNPWFIGSQPVTYCIQVDSRFSTESGSISDAIQNSISFWKKDLNRNSDDLLQLGQNEWKEVSCAEEATQKENPDLVFYIGSKALPGKLKDLLKNSESESGFVARSNYDLKNLRGQGAIYFAWNKTENSSASVQLTSLQKRAYLVHLLGYSFGYFGPRWGITAGEFHQRASLIFREGRSLSPILSEQIEILSCSEKKCLEIKGPNFEDRYYITQKNPEHADDNQDFGWVAFSKKDSPKKENSNSIVLTLPEQQKVFQNPNAKQLQGPGMWAAEGPGNFSTKEKGSGSKNPVWIEMSPIRLRVLQNGSKNSGPKVFIDARLRHPEKNIDVSDGELMKANGGRQNGTHSENRKKAAIFIRERDAKKAKLFLDGFQPDSAETPPVEKSIKN